MARPCEFDEAEVLERATAAFWKGGYDGTALEDLLRATGIGRQSLYGRFGDKRALFLRCLRTYQEKRIGELKDFFVRHRPVTAAFSIFFGSLINLTDEAKRSGCMTLNTAMELGRKDVEVADLVARNQRNIEEVFVGALEAGRTRGELPQAFDCRAVGRFLVGVFLGLVAMGKSDPDSPALADLVQTALQVLAPPAPQQQQAAL